MINKFRQIINIETNTILKTYLIWFLIGIFGIHRMVHLNDNTGKYMLYLSLGAFVIYLVFGMLLAAPILLALFVWWAIDSFLMVSWFQPIIKK